MIHLHNYMYIDIYICKNVLEYFVYTCSHILYIYRYINFKIQNFITQDKRIYY